MRDVKLRKGWIRIPARGTVNTEAAGHQDAAVFEQRSRMQITACNDHRPSLVESPRSGLIEFWRGKIRAVPPGAGDQHGSIGKRSSRLQTPPPDHASRSAE